MKKNLFFIITITVLIVVCSCGPRQSQYKSTPDTSNSIKNDTIRIANDSLEYEVIIIEPGFNSWLVTQPPRGYRGQAGMDISNDFKVVNYNLRVNQPLIYDPNLYMQRIDYESDIDYGYEVTYLLFNYFRFFEERYNQKL